MAVAAPFSESWSESTFGSVDQGQLGWSTMRAGVVPGLAHQSFNVPLEAGTSNYFAVAASEDVHLYLSVFDQNGRPASSEPAGEDYWDTRNNKVRVVYPEWTGPFRVVVWSSRGFIDFVLGVRTYAHRDTYPRSGQIAAPRQNPTEATRSRNHDMMMNYWGEQTRQAAPPPPPPAYGG